MAVRRRRHQRRRNQPIVYPPALYPQYFYALPVRHHGHTGHNSTAANGWPLFRR